MPELPPWPKEQEQQQHDVAKNDLMGPGPWPKTAGAADRDADIERGGGAPRTGDGGNQNPVSSWKVPSAWKEPSGQRQGQQQRRSLDMDEHERDDDISHGSDVTLQHLNENGHVPRGNE